jgi:hypothetical protein
VIAFYDPEPRRFFVVSGAEASTGADEGVAKNLIFSHELMHALQDESLHLDARVKELKDDSDKASALQCLLEGEATIVMVRVALQSMPGADEAIEDQLAPLLTAGALEKSNVPSDVPEFFADQLFFRTPTARSSSAPRSRRAAGRRSTGSGATRRSQRRDPARVALPRARDRNPLARGAEARARAAPDLTPTRSASGRCGSCSAVRFRPMRPTARPRAGAATGSRSSPPDPRRATSGGSGSTGRSPRRASRPRFGPRARNARSRCRRRSSAGARTWSWRRESFEARVPAVILRRAAVLRSAATKEPRLTRSLCFDPGSFALLR